jgi:hypothetical protein
MGEATSHRKIAQPLQLACNTADRTSNKDSVSSDIVDRVDEAGEPSDPVDTSSLERFDETKKISAEDELRLGEESGVR